MKYLKIARYRSENNFGSKLLCKKLKRDKQCCKKFWFSSN